MQKLVGKDKFYIQKHISVHNVFKMSLKYTVKATERRTIVVDEVTHLLLKHYARRKGITVVEATFKLLRKALAEAAGLQVEDSDT